MTTVAMISTIFGIITVGFTVGAIIAEATGKGKDPFVYIATITIGIAALVASIFAACGVTCALGFGIPAVIIAIIAAALVWIFCDQSETNYPEMVIIINLIIIAANLIMMMCAH